MATETTTAATPSGDAATGQAAGVGQATPPAANPPATGGNPTTGSPGSPASTSPQPGTTTATTTTTTAPAGTASPATPPAAPPPAVPARYELTLPEQTVLDQADVEAITAMAKTKGWTNDQAQVALDEWHTSLATQHTTFRTELDSDPEVGGANLEHAQVLAKRVLDRFLPAAHPQGQRLRVAMNKSGYGNFLPLVLLLSRLGKAMSEDQPGFHPGGATFAQPDRTHADVLFGSASGVRK